MDKTNKRAKCDSVLLCGTQAGFWAGCTVFSTFLITYLYGRGYSATQVGLIVALMSAFNLVFQPLWGYIADTKISLKRVILLCLGISVPLGCLMPFFARTTFLLVIGSLLVACFDNPVRGLLDSLTNIAESRNRYIVYGVARGCGSFFSAVACLFVGDILDRYGIEWAFGIHGILLSVAFVFLLCFSETPCRDDAVEKEQAVVKSPGRGSSPGKRAKKTITMGEAAGTLLGNKAFCAVFASTILLNIGLKAALTFAPIMIVQMGGTSVHNGYSMAINTVGMLPCMLVYSWLYKKKKLSNNNLYMLACFFTVARIFSMALADSLWMTIGIQIINSLSYGFLQPAMICAISDVAPGELRATAITLVTGGHVAISSILGDYVAGLIVDAFGMKEMFWICTALAVLGTLAYLPVMKAKRA